MSTEPSPERESESADAHRLIAACFDALDGVPAMLAAEPGLLVARTTGGETAFHWLAVERRLDAMQVIAACGAGLDAVDGYGMTALAYAAEHGEEAMAAWLLAQGARIDVPGECAPTLHWAVRGGRPAIVSMVLAAGADVDRASRGGNTALHDAARSDASIGILRHLLAAGATGGRANRRGQTPLDLAHANGATAAVALLEAHPHERRT